MSKRDTPNNQTAVSRRVGSVCQHYDLQAEGCEFDAWSIFVIFVMPLFGKITEQNFGKMFLGKLLSKSFLNVDYA